MLQELIARTNNDAFYNDCNLTLKSYSFDAINRVAVIAIALQNVSFDEPEINEEWAITGSNAEKISGFSAEILLPYIKLQLIEKHPLLWKYHDDELECKIQGIPADFNKLVFDLVRLFEKEIGNWILLQDILGHFHPNMFKMPNIINIPSSLEKHLYPLFIGHGLSFEISSFTAAKDKGYNYNPDAKVLMFGNEDVCPNRHNGGQPYIVAADFIAERIK